MHERNNGAAQAPLSTSGRQMSGNESNNPATSGDDVILGTSGDDILTGGAGNDQIFGGDGDDLISANGPVPGQWLFRFFDFSLSGNGIAFQIENAGSYRDTGYVSDFDVTQLANSIRGTTGNPHQFGIIYTSTLNITAGGLYRFQTRSDDGSTLQIFDADGNALDILNQNSQTLDFLDNDRAQSATTRWGEVTLDSDATYTIEIRFWERNGTESLRAEVRGPDTGGQMVDIFDSGLIGTPPEPQDLPGINNPFASGGWAVEVWDHDFSSANGQAFDIENGTLLGTGYTGDFDVTRIVNDARGTSGDPNNFGVILTSTLSVETSGLFDFRTTSDDGSTIRIFDSGGNALIWTNQPGAPRDFLDNDFHQPATTRSASLNLQAGETYTIEIRHWENQGQEVLSAGIRGPDTGDQWENLLTFDGIGTPPDIEISLGTQSPWFDLAPGDNIIDAGAGSDTIILGSGSDTILANSFGGGEGVVDTIIGFDPDRDIADLSEAFNTLSALRAAAQTEAEGLRVTLPDGAQVFFSGLTAPAQLTGTNTLVPCFTPGARIATPGGPRNVESLRPGDMVLTRDSGPQPVRWVGVRRLDAATLQEAIRLRPVLIPAGALGPDLPARDLMLSPQHRILLAGAGTHLVTGEAEVLAPARTLEGRGGIRTILPENGVRYVHILFDRHEVVTADGLPCESLYPGPAALDAFEDRTREELLTLFPMLRSGPRGPFPLARPVVNRHEALCAAFG
ncbi:MAG: Hint domain-containing protein [Rhodobacteraceae bacterium]|nr:Hint domain-containing protein [Paracoccaceae bacterium]